MKVAVARIAMLVAAFGQSVRGEVQTTLPSPVRARMPEPLLTESITDLDGAVTGEVEIDVGASALRRAKDRKSTRLNSSHSQISYAVFCLKKKTHTVT